jgi:hypothetical protein
MLGNYYTETYGKVSKTWGFEATIWVGKEATIMKLVSMTYYTFIQCNFRFHPLQKKLNYSELIQTSSLGLQSTCYWS